MKRSCLFVMADAGWQSGGVLSSLRKEVRLPADIRYLQTISNSPEINSFRQLARFWPEYARRALRSNR